MFAQCSYNESLLKELNKMYVPTFAKEFLALGSIFVAGYMWSFIL